MKQFAVFWEYWRKHEKIEINNIKIEKEMAHVAFQGRKVVIGFFEFVHNVGKRGKALLHSLIELLIK